MVLLAVEDYIASIGKGHLYAAFEKIPLSDITIAFAVNKYPRNVIMYLKDVRKFIVTDNGNGLYSICGDVFPVQILLCKKDDNIILKNLHDRLTPTEVVETIRAFEKLRPGEKNVYIERIILANWNAYKEASKMYPTWKECVLEIEKEGWFVERDIERDRQRDIENARILKSNNVPISVIFQTTKTLSLEEVEAL